MVDPCRQCGNYFDGMMLGGELFGIGKKCKHGGMFNSFLFVDEVFEYGKRSSLGYPAVDESEFHEKRINV